MRNRIIAAVLVVAFVGGLHVDTTPDSYRDRMHTILDERSARFSR